MYILTPLSREKILNEGYLATLIRAFFTFYMTSLASELLPFITCHSMQIQIKCQMTRLKVKFIIGLSYIEQSYQKFHHVISVHLC